MLESRSQVLVFLLLVFNISFSNGDLSCELFIIVFSDFFRNLDSSVSFNQSINFNVFLSCNFLEHWLFNKNSNINFDHFFNRDFNISCYNFFNILFQNSIDLNMIFNQSFYSSYIFSLSSEIHNNISIDIVSNLSHSLNKSILCNQFLLRNFLESVDSFFNILRYWLFYNSGYFVFIRNLNSSYNRYCFLNCLLI